MTTSRAAKKIKTRPAPIDDPPELTREDFERMLRVDQRKRIIAGRLEPGDVAALRRFVGLTQEQFAEALGISVRTLQNWEQDRVKPDGPGLALLRYLAVHPEGVTTSAAYDAVAESSGLTEVQRQELLPSGRQPIYKNRIGWAQDRLKRRKFSFSPKHGAHSRCCSPRVAVALLHRPRTARPCQAPVA